jgi:integrase
MFEEKIKAGKYPCNVTFMTFAEDYRANYAKTHLRPTTFEKETYITKRVYPAIGHKKLGKITRRDIMMFANYLVNECTNEKTGKPLAYKTIKSHISFISRVFSYAIELGALSDNPARNIKIPKTEENKPKEIEIYDPEELCQLGKLLDEKAPLKHKVFLNLLIVMGGRKGEVLGLEWKDIDFKTRLIAIRRASYYTPEKGIYASDPKTEKSKRVKQYSQELFDLLAKYKQEQDEYKANLGDKWQEHDRLFTQWNGKPMHPNTPYDWLKEFCEKNNFQFHCLHSLRHSHSSIKICNGVSPAELSADLGHSSINVTLGVYAHIFAKVAAKESTIVDKAVGLIKDKNTFILRGVCNIKYYCAIKAENGAV